MILGVVLETRLGAVRGTRLRVVEWKGRVRAGRERAGRARMWCISIETVPIGKDGKAYSS